MKEEKVLCFIITGDNVFLPAYVEIDLIVAGLNGDKAWMEGFEGILPKGYSEREESIKFEDMLVPVRGGIISFN